MANNLYPEDMIFNETNLQDYEDTPEDIIKKLKKTYAFDFEKGEFIKDKNGNVLLLNEFESYLFWCRKALETPRFKKMAYSNLYGQELYTLIGSGLDKKAQELEVTRMVQETLLVHPYTKEVKDFSFKWDKNKSALHYNFTIITLLDEKETLKKVWEIKG